MLWLLDHHPGRIVEDAVVGYQRYPKAQCSRCNPTVCVMVTLSQCLPDAFTVSSELGLGENEIGACMHGLRGPDPGLQFSHPLLSPPPTEGSVAEFRRRLTRDERRSADDDGLIPPRQSGPTDQIGSEHVRVDDDRATRGLDAHPSRTARKAAP